MFFRCGSAPDYGVRPIRNAGWLARAPEKQELGAAVGRPQQNQTHSITMAKTPSKKSAKAPKKAAGGKKKKTRVESYSTYIYRVLKQVHPDTGISKKGAHPRPDAQAAPGARRFSWESHALSRYASRLRADSLTWSALASSRSTPPASSGVVPPVLYWTAMFMRPTLLRAASMPSWLFSRRRI